MNVPQATATSRPRLGKLRAAGTQVRAAIPGFAAIASLGAVALVALLAGAVVALGSNQLTVLLIGLLVFVPIVLFVGVKNMLPLMFVFVFGVQGAVHSFMNLRMATWLASGMGMLLFARALLELINLRVARRGAGASLPGAGAIVLAAGLYLLFFFFSLALGHASAPQILSAVRFCIPMLSVLFVLYWFEWSELALRRLWLLLVLIALLQIPVVAYQHFFTIQLIGWDGVVGTFGMGMSAMLVLFSLTAMVYFLSRWTRGLASGKITALVFCIGMATILLGEVKAVVLWIPLGLFLVMRRRVLKNAFAFFTFGLFIAAFVAGTFTVYQALYWGEHGSKGHTIEEKFDSTSGYILNPNGLNYVTGEVSRMASLSLWYRDPGPTAQERLIGYGPGASMSSKGTGKGVVARRYRTLEINATALASMLWDVGVLGTLSYLALLVMGLVAGVRYVRRGGGNAEQNAMVDTSLVVLCLMGTTLLYNRTLVDEPTVQLLFYFSLGCIAQHCRFHSTGAAPASGGRGATAHNPAERPLPALRS